MRRRGRNLERDPESRPHGWRADAPNPLHTHILEERVSGGPKGRRWGKVHRRPDQAHGEQPCTRHGAATRSAPEGLRLAALDAAARDLRELGGGDARPLAPALTPRAPRPEAPPPA